MVKLNRIYREFSIALEGLKKGILEIAITTSENAQVAKLLYRIFELEKKMEKLSVEIGKMVYELRNLPFDEILNTKEIKYYVNSIRTTQQDIYSIEKEVNLLREDSIKSKLDEIKRYMRRGGYTIEELIVGKNSEVLSKKIEELKLPPGVIIISVISGEMFNIPEEGMVLNEGDRVFILGSIDRIRDAASQFRTPEVESRMKDCR